MLTNGSLVWLMTLLHYFVLDVDECMISAHSCICDIGSMDSLCFPGCINTEGSYACSCSSGFVLDAAGYTCIGEFTRRHTVKQTYSVNTLATYPIMYTLSTNIIHVNTSIGSLV